MPGLKTLAGLMFREAVVNGASEALIQAEVQDWYKTLELPYTWETFANKRRSGSSIRRCLSSCF